MKEDWDAHRQGIRMSTLYDVPVDRIDGAAAALRDYAGSVILIVNVASKCGLTPQYTALESLYESHRDRGLVVLGFPANNFGAQEPGENAEIAAFCSTTYDVQFPLFAKISVLGDDQHELYRELIAQAPTATVKPGSDFRAELLRYGITPGRPIDVLWNFEKFLVDRQGNVVARFAPDVTPDDPLLLDAIERELAKS
jgi:glutathione peroxidase